MPRKKQKIEDPQEEVLNLIDDDLPMRDLAVKLVSDLKNLQFEILRMHSRKDEMYQYLHDEHKAEALKHHRKLPAAKRRLEAAVLELKRTLEDGMDKVLMCLPAVKMAVHMLKETRHHPLISLEVAVHMINVVLRNEDLAAINPREFFPAVQWQEPTAVAA